MLPKIRGICAPYRPSNGLSLAVTSASTSAETLATNSARRAAQSALLRWSAKTTPDNGNTNTRTRRPCSLISGKRLTRCSARKE